MSLPEISGKTLARSRRLSDRTTYHSNGGNDDGVVLRRQDDPCGPTVPTTSLLTSSGSSDYLTAAVNVDDFQILARRKLPRDLYEYLASGSDNEQTLQENRMAFDRWYLRPRVMRPVGRLSTATRLFGHAVSMPVFVSPAGVHALCDPEHGECATARACARTGILMGVSQHATRTMEQVAEAVSTTTTTSTNDVSSTVPQFYQAYILKDRMRTLSLIRRAVRAGYQGIFLTVDSVRFGYREADVRNGFNALPAPHRLVNYDHDDDNDSFARDCKTSPKALDETYNSQEKKAWDQNSEQLFEQDVTWEDVAWIKREMQNMTGGKGDDSLPLVIKGIMTAEDALLAIQASADGIMVSNHGGRQLDACLGTIDVLPEVVKAVDGRVPVWLDGGVRRGTDVLKALALGASAVGIGKPLFFALGVGGEDALVYMLQLLQTEVEATMAICGVEKISDITSTLVTRHPAASSSSISRPTFSVRSSL